MEDCVTLSGFKLLSFRIVSSKMSYSYPICKNFDDVDTRGF